jgi:hypothetical protein
LTYLFIYVKFLGGLGKSTLMAIIGWLAQKNMLCAPSVFNKKDGRERWKEFLVLDWICEQSLWSYDQKLSSQKTVLGTAGPWTLAQGSLGLGF